MANTTISDMRNILKKKYPTVAWAAKVDKMKDDQVQAIYLRMQNKKT